MEPGDTGLLLDTLRSLDVVLARLATLADVAVSDLPANLASDIGNLRERVERQSRKLVAGEAHVAVIGLEKAGKSTLINAWLNADVLPNEQNRCTYATTELRSAEHDASQAVRIEYLDLATYREIEKGYQERVARGGRDADEANKDLDEMRRYQDTILSLLGRTPEVIAAPDMESVGRILWEKVANPKIARALRRVTLYSPKLYQRRGLIFHDVPGYDSPISMHKKQARDELARADVILFVQNASATVSLTGPQLEMLDVADAEDPDIKVHDKLFVFLNRIDQTTGDLPKRLEKSRVEWSSKAHCPADRIVPGSAAAYLAKKASFLRPETREAIQYAPDGLERLNAPHGDGVVYLQQLIERYLNEERVHVIRRRVVRMVEEGRRLTNVALEALDGRYPETSEEIDQRLRVAEITGPARWFDTVWEDFQRRFGKYWVERIAPATQDDHLGINANFERLRTVYRDAVQEVAKNFPTIELIEEEHARLRADFPTPVAVNIQVRRAMLERYVDPGLERVTAAMMRTVVDVAREVADWVVSEGFYGVEGVRAVVFPERSMESYAKTVEVGLRTLFLRYARPASAMFLRTARNTEDRRHMLDHFQLEVRVLSQFYDNPKAPLHRFLEGFLKDGAWFDPNTIDDAAAAVAGGVARASGYPSLAPIAEGGARTIAQRIREGTATNGGSPSRSVSFVSEEIASDCAAFLDYLEHSIYRAAAFEAFAMQELNRIRTPLLATSAREARDAIREVVFAAYVRRHPPLLAAYGAGAADDAHVRQVVEAVSGLRGALTDLDHARAAPPTNTPVPSTASDAN